ncbi:cell envelope biogenesis protein OmpA [Wolbachia endosymbiont of Anopheles demeilloni]|uniref:cell envelope biogenesis protein OmpA n=1 Tax=Wolbachia endosymbiont of Anopheles demeilloni TaxID=2748871 RepID=UPI001BD93924|nr:cell envelope biogenesis protein OmpA [Wolbachia endosymbiont of Anopheles demeilloni]UIP92314.1 cell envelope biogenesis protein OmpA [Wolbachia endosymbiont of Anopheles demeilloni]
MKKLFAILFASSLASTASSSASELEDQYYVGYVGLNFGAGWGDTFKMKPSVVFGYNYNKSSKFELEVLVNISDITDKQKRKVGASLLANYRYYPDLEIDPIKLYASIGLSGYIQVLPSFDFGSSSTGETTGKNVADSGDLGKIVNEDGTEDNNKREEEEKSQEAPALLAADGSKVTSDPSLVDKILNSISYKLKVGVDYEFTPQIVATVAIVAGGQLSGFKPPMKKPDAIIEVGIRYNF